MDDKLYEVCDLPGSGLRVLLRAAGWSFAAVFGLGMLMTNFVRVTVYPTVQWTLQAASHDPEKWWPTLYASLGAAALASVVVMMGALLTVEMCSFSIYANRIGVRMQAWQAEIPFSAITATEWISYHNFPRLTSFWADLKSQLRTLRLGPRYRSLGVGPQRRTGITTVLKIECTGKRWWKGYLLEVDDGGKFRTTLESALEHYRSADAQPGSRGELCMTDCQIRMAEPTTRT